MPRKTPVRELQAEEESLPASPLRRSSRLASPLPSKLLQRRNSATEEAPAKLPKAKRLSLSTRRESDDVMLETDETHGAKILDVPKRTTRATRSSSKSPTSLPSETETKPRTRSRTGSISKIIEEEISSENEEDLGRKSSKNGKPKDTPSKPKTRRSSVTDKVPPITSLDVIEESPKLEPQSKTALIKKDSLKSITELGNESEETEAENKVITVEETAVSMSSSTEKEKNVSADTKSLIQPSNIKAISQEITTNGTKESTSKTYTKEKGESDTCKMSPVVVLNSIEKQLNYSEEKTPSKKVEMSPTKDETKSVSNKSPVVFLQSIEKIISKQNQEKDTELIESGKNSEENKNENEAEKIAAREKSKDKVTEEQPLNLIDKDTEVNENENKETNVKEKLKDDVKDHISEGEILTNRNESEEVVMNAKEKLNDTEKGSTEKNQSTDQKILIDELELNPLEKQVEIKEVITPIVNQCSEVSTNEIVKESLSSLLVNQLSIIDGSDGSFNMSLTGTQNNTQEDISNQSKMIDSTNTDNISNITENSDEENSNFNDKIESPARKDKPSTSEMKSDVANSTDADVIEPKQNLTATNESVLAGNVSKNIELQTEKTEQSSFYEPMEIEYTDFNCTINSSVVESKDNERSLSETNVNETDAKLLHHNEEDTAKTNIDEAINEQSELKMANVTEQNKLHDDGTPIKQMSNKVTDNKDSNEELLNQSRSDSIGNEDIQDITRESDVYDKSVNNTTDQNIEEAKQLNESNVDVVSTKVRKSISFAFNLDDDQLLSDEDVNDKNLKEKNDVGESSLGRSKLESEVTFTRDDDQDITEQNENHPEKKGTQRNAPKSPSPVFSVDENQCFSDDETDGKNEDQKMKKHNEIDGADKPEQSNEEEINKPEELQSPSPMLDTNGSQSDTKAESLTNKNDVRTRGSNEMICVSDILQITNANVESKEDKTDCVLETAAVISNLITNADKKQSSGNLPVTENQQENPESIKSVNPTDEQDLMNQDPKYWKSKTKKLCKKRRKSHIEDNLTSTVRALIENVDDLDAKVDALIEKEKGTNNPGEDASDDEISQNSFIDDMAEEGEEDTPSEGSNDIPIEGESLDSADTTCGSDDSYEQDSFINDEEYNSLLSGEEDFLEGSKRQGKPVKKRFTKLHIISDSESNDDQSQVQLIEEKESLQTKSASCDSDDKMSTDPYLGLTPPSHVSVQESSSDLDIRSVNNENEIIINDDDNLKSLEAMRDETVPPTSKQIEVAKASSIICLDSDEDVVFQKLSEPNDLSRAERLQNEADQKPTRSPKNMSSLNIQESIKLEDVNDGTLTNKICGIVDFFYSNIKQNNSMSGTVSLNVSLDFADVAEQDLETQSTTEDSNVEHIKIKSLRKRLSEGIDSFSDKENETSKKMKYTASPQASVSNEEAPSTTPATIKKIKHKKPYVSDFDVESIEMHNISPSMKSKTIIKQKKLPKERINKKENEDPINVSVEKIKTKHQPSKEISERKKDKIEEKKTRKIEEIPCLIEGDKEKETVSLKDTKDKKLKRKKIKSNKALLSEDEVENEDIIEDVSEDETLRDNDAKGKFSEVDEHEKSRKKDKKKKKKSKHLLEMNDDNAVVNDNENNENLDKVHAKKKLMKFYKQEMQTEAENTAVDEADSNDKTHKKKKLKLIKSGEAKTEEVLTNTEQRKKKKSKSVFDNEMNPIVDDDTQTFNLKSEIKSTTSEVPELTSNEKSKKPKRKRRHDETDEDIWSKEIVSSKVPSKSEDEIVTSHKKQKKRYDTGSFRPSANEMGETISHFPSHMLEKLSTKTIEEIPKIKKSVEKRLTKRPAFSMSAPADSDSWTSTPLETAIVPSKKNNLHSDASTSKSAKKRKLQETSETFSSKDFKNKMLYDSSRMKRMSSKELLKNKMKTKLVYPHY